MPTKTQNRIVANRILETLKTVAVIPDLFDLSYFTVRINFDALWDDFESVDKNIMTINSIIDMLVRLQETEIVQLFIPTSCVIATINLLSHCAKRLKFSMRVAENAGFDQLLTKLFHELVSLTITTIKLAERTTDADLIYSLNDCYAIIQIALLDQCYFLPLRKFCDFVKIKGKWITSSDQECIAMDIRSVNSKDWQSDGNISYVRSSTFVQMF